MKQVILLRNTIEIGEPTQPALRPRSARGSIPANIVRYSRSGRSLRRDCDAQTLGRAGRDPAWILSMCHWICLIFCWTFFVWYLMLTIMQSSCQIRLYLSKRSWDAAKLKLTDTETQLTSPHGRVMVFCPLQHLCWQPSEIRQSYRPANHCN